MNVLRKLILLLLLLFVIKANAQDYRNYFGVGYGINAWLTERGVQNVIGNGVSVEAGYFPKGKIGLIAGINYFSDAEGYDRMINIPTYFAFRTVSKEKYPKGARIFGLAFGILFPREVIFYAGPSWGYVGSSNKFSMVSINGGPFQPDDGYITDPNFIATFDLGIKPKFYIWRFRLGFDIGMGFILTNNFTYKSSDKYLNGYKPNKDARVKVTLDYAL